MNTDANHRINLFDSVISELYQDSVPKRCSGKGCAKIAKNLLMISYVKKKGYFCDDCTSDLLAGQLAVRMQEVLSNE